MTPQEHARDLILKLSAVRADDGDAVTMAILLTIQAAVNDERERCARVAEKWLADFGSYKPEHVGGQTWANDAVRDIADAIRRGSRLSSPVDGAAS